MILRDFLGKRQISDFKIVRGRVRANAERVVGGAEIAAAGEFVGYFRNANVRRNVLSASKFMRNHGAETRKFYCRTGFVSGEHVVGAVACAPSPWVIERHTVILSAILATP